jgi:hypothetical protein
MGSRLRGDDIVGSASIAPDFQFVMAGLDPAIHLF